MQVISARNNIKTNNEKKVENSLGDLGIEVSGKKGGSGAVSSQQMGLAKYLHSAFNTDPNRERMRRSKNRPLLGPQTRIDPVN